MSNNPCVVPHRTFTRLDRSSDKQLAVIRSEMLSEVRGVFKESRKLAAARNGLAAVERELNRRLLGVE